MEIGIYHPWLKEKGGAEKVVLEYARRSEHEVTVFTQFYDSEETFEEFKQLEIEIIGSNTEPRNFIDKGVRFGLGSLVKKIPSKDLDALVVSEAGIGSLITLRNNDLPILCYCHTPLRAAHPEFKQLYMEEQPFYARPIYRFGTSVYSFLEKRAWKNFDYIAANSQTTKERIIAKHLAQEEKIEVVHPGADIEENQGGKYENYFLYPSRFRRYKRQDLAIKAFEEADLENFKLVLAGSNQDPEYVEELRNMAGENVEIKTDLLGDEWKELYRNCYSVLFLAENEDWGIIPVEAASYSKPVIAVDDGGPTESVINRETGFLVQPEPGEIADQMKLLAGDKEKTEEIGKKARKESRKYSWNSFASEIDSGLDDIG